MKILAIAATNLRRTLRDRTTLMFVVVFPLLLVLILGLAFGGSSRPRVGLVANDAEPLSAALVADLTSDPGITIVRYADEGALITDVEHGTLEAGVWLPPNYDSLAAGSQPVVLHFLARSGLAGQQIGSVVQSVVDGQNSRLQAARFASTHTGAGLSASVRAVDQLAAAEPLLSVTATSTGDAVFPSTVGQFDVGASSQLVLFVFLNSMTGAAALIETRRLGLSRRMLATPTRTSTILLGEGLGRFALAATQAVVIMVGSALLFGVQWGDPLAAGVLVVAFCVVASGAGMLLGTTARTSQQAIAVGLLLGLGLGAIGGAMVPLDFFSESMQTVAHFTPHAWALDGLASLLRSGGDIVSIAPALGVLIGFAALLFAVATWRFRRVASR